MKSILVISDWDFAYIWREVIKSVKERWPEASIHVLVIGRMYAKEYVDCGLASLTVLQDFLEDFSKVEFSANKLDALQDMYGAGVIWNGVWADRNWVKLNEYEISKRVIETYGFYEKLFDQVNPDVVYTNAYASMPHYVGKVVGEKRMIPFIKPVHTRIKDYQIQSSTLQEKFEPNLEDLTEEDLKIAAEAIEDICDKYEKPSYEINQSGKFNFDIGLAFRGIRYIYRKYISGEYKGDHTKEGVIERVYNNVVVRGRRYYQKRFKEYSPIPENFVYFPLHVQPEASTMLLAPLWLDQVFVIEAISKSLPLGCAVVVKEHPQMVGKRELDFYKRLGNIPNVVIVNPFENSLKVQKKSKAVFSITGTAAFEAAMLGKPSFILGETIFRNCPGVTALDNISIKDWRKLIEIELSHITPRDEVVDFIASLLKSSWRINFCEPNLNKDVVLTTENLKRISEFFIAETEKSILNN
ncbi:hypothetical protein [Endozoicomonas sp. SCSIO W0465]|uniref:capsular polysaccharide export protein, LipB/KpsS family n=1 Tax=Endozoicomonas sp. SCSIO W0465 TaxID=2918516 RepID=UPI0020765373|nr:hypothetical protein [Endozoicomonas sp. SCSIO W0465]USE39415.1 hypothetical protein MJO57_15360 [Endozoicomonas sp. SCSIO W0465]